MNEIAFLLSGGLFFLGIVLLIAAFFKKQALGSLAGGILYSDTQENPGDILYAESLRLVGKPDYIIQQHGAVIPVEVKTGKTPTQPYHNHVMQLFAYCILIESTYKTTPPGGYIRYPDEEFWVDYTPDNKQEVIVSLEHMRKVLAIGKAPTCNHPAHNL